MVRSILSHPPYGRRGSDNSNILLWCMGVFYSSVGGIASPTNYGWRNSWLSCHNLENIVWGRRDKGGDSDDNPSSRGHTHRFKGRVGAWPEMGRGLS